MIMKNLLQKSKSRLAEFVGAKNRNIIFVNNATTGVNTGLSSIDFKPGDEIVISSHIYPACRNAVQNLALRKSLVVNEAAIPFPVDSQEVIIDLIEKQFSSHTKLLLIDHITSATGLKFPVEEMVRKAHKQGIEVLIDGAHAPGMIELNLEALQADYYTGNCHKWVCSPKGSAFLYVAPAKQDKIFPLSISLFYGENIGFEQRFSWQGTDDPTAFLCVGDTLDYMESIFPGGWKGIMESNRDLVLEARNHLCSELNIPQPVPDDLIANLVSIPLPDATTKNESNPMQDILYRQLNSKFGIELFVATFPEFPKRLFRISPQIYNSFDQYRYLAGSLKKLL